LAWQYAGYVSSGSIVYHGANSWYAQDLILLLIYRINNMELIEQLVALHN
jgi:hypothetical protein